MYVILALLQTAHIPLFDGTDMLGKVEYTRTLDSSEDNIQLLKDDNKEK